MNEPSDLIKQGPAARDLERPIDVLHHPPSYRYDAGELEPEEGIHWRLHDYWRSARKHIWLILGILVLVTTLAAIYTARQPDIFEAKAQVQVDTENTNPALGAFKSNNIIVNSSYTDPIYFNTQIQILTSAGLLGRVIRTLDLENNQAFLRPQPAQSRSTWESLKRMAGFGDKSKDAGKDKGIENAPLIVNFAPVTSRDDLVEVNRLAPLVAMLQGGLTVKQVPDTRLIEIRYKHQDPLVASKIVNAVSDAFVLSNLERRTETSATAGDFLQRRIAELQVEIRRGEEQLLNYGKEHQILSLDESQNTVVERLAGLNRQLMEAEKERTDAEAKYLASRDPSRAEAQAAESTTKQTGETENKLAELRQKRAQLLVSYTEKYPEVKEIDQQIAVLEKQLKETSTKATNVVVKNYETRFLEAKSKEDTLRASFNKQRGETLAQNEAAVNYKLIDQGVQTNTTLLDGLLQRSKENDVVLAGTPNNIHIVDRSPVPKGAVGPRRMQSLALAMLISLVFGVALARYLDYLDDSIHSAEDVEKTLRLPALAVIPAIGSLSRRRLRSSNMSLQRQNGSGTSPLLLDISARSPLAEAYKQLRTSVLLSSAGGAPKTLLVTSSQPAEGKTTTAVNTAMSLAQTGATVLVIDADMRRPRVHDILDTDNSRGLSTILASKMTEAEMLSLIEKHEKSGLYVLPSGPIPPNPAELTGSDQMRRLLAVFESNFDHIVIDSPPISSFTDGVLISAMVDGVLLVVHGGRSSRNVVRRARQVLQEVGAKIFGVVLNNVTLSTKDDYYKYYYNHYNYYKTGQDPDELASGTGS